MEFSINTLEQEKKMLKNHCKDGDILFCKKREIPIYLPEISVEKEYSSKLLEAEKERIEKIWKKEAKDFQNKIKIFFNRKLDITIYITNYSTFGSYDPKVNSIFINRNIGNKHITRIIKHEVIHLLLNDYIKKFNINSEQKEDIVNSIVSVLNCN